MRKTLLFIFVMAIGFALPGIRLSLAATLEVGQPAPPLVVEQVDGKTFDLSAMKGNVVLMHMWAPWCAPCMQEMPVMDSYYKKHHAEGLEIIALDIDAPYSRARDQMKEMISKVTYPGALLRDQSTGAYEAPKAVPASYVIDRAGIVREIKVPDDLPLSEDDLDEVLGPWMKSKSTTP